VGGHLATRLATALAGRSSGWKDRRLVLVADSRIARRLTPPIKTALASRGAEVRLLTVRPGERSKTRQGKADLEDRLLAARFGRDTLLLALGGGTILDLAGFVAATYTRGVPWIALPTTLLAMVDASIGGKTAINHPRGKNLIGSFHHPAAVYADIEWLSTLPPREYRNGLAEVVKIATGLSEPLFRRLERSATVLLDRGERALARVVAEAIALKGSVVVRDELEGGYRQALNFGHTIGHALETASGYRLSHGEAVSIGLVAESRIARRTGRFTGAAVRRVEALLVRLGLPVRLPRRIDPRDVLALTRSDKKVRGGEVRYALPARIGRMDPSFGWSQPIPDDLVLEALRTLGRPPC
jgi:3-dehydroquinate synthase